MRRARAPGAAPTRWRAQAHPRPAGRATLVEQAPRVVVEKRRARATPRQAPFLEAEHEDDIEPARTGACKVEHGDAPGLVAAERTQRLAFEHRCDVLARNLAREGAPA